MLLTDADRAYEQIKHRIVTIEMAPGSVINEADLMDSLSLGRTPIREALKRLQAENLVTVKPRRGMFVAGITITDLTQVYEVRVEVESLCARLAAERITVAQLAYMKGLIEQYRTGDMENIQWLFSIDRQFHCGLAEGAHNKFLINEVDHFYNLSLRIWYMALTYVKPEDIDVSAHVDLVTAVEARDPEAADRIMREHIRHFQSTIKRYL